MNKKQEIQKALTAAMKAQDKATKRTLRLVMSSIKLSEVDEGGEIDDSRVLSLLQKEVKTREDVIDEAKSANREDLIEAAMEEISILEKFLPEQMREAELRQLAQAVIADTSASDMKDMGEVMKQLTPKLQGRASGQEASKMVRELLQNK